MVRKCKTSAVWIISVAVKVNHPRLFLLQKAAESRDSTKCEASLHGLLPACHLTFQQLKLLCSNFDRWKLCSQGISCTLQERVKSQGMIPWAQCCKNNSSLMLEGASDFELNTFFWCLVIIKFKRFKIIRASYTCVMLDYNISLHFDWYDYLWHLTITIVNSIICKWMYMVSIWIQFISRSFDEKTVKVDWSWWTCGYIYITTTSRPTHMTNYVVCGKNDHIIRFLK